MSEGTLDTHLCGDRPLVETEIVEAEDLNLNTDPDPDPDRQVSSDQRLIFAET